MPLERLAAAPRPVTRALVLRIAALGALTVVLGARAIDSDVYEGGEAREALVAREMLDTGDWILPLWNGSVVPSKPPLFHWLVASSARLTGGQVTVRTLRAPSVVLGGVVVVVVFLAGLAWGGAEVGTFAALVLVTTPQFLTEASDGRVDMTLTAAVTGAQVAVVQALGVRRGARLVLALCLAFAMLAKGPIGPGLVGLTALAFAARERQLRPVLGLVRPLPVLLFVVVAGGWYALAYAHRGMDFVAKQILSENGEALLGSSRFPYRSPLYYVAPLVLGGFPWTLVVPWAAARAWGGERPRRYAVVWAASSSSRSPRSSAPPIFSRSAPRWRWWSAGGWRRSRARRNRRRGSAVPLARWRTPSRPGPSSPRRARSPWGTVSSRRRVSGTSPCATRSTSTPTRARSPHGSSRSLPWRSRPRWRVRTRRARSGARAGGARRSPRRRPWPASPSSRSEYSCRRVPPRSPSVPSRSPCARGSSPPIG
ncbi:MAG: hypothetical protein E6J79_00950 [Deltaproteobacteria bacterium]|nr:MAG: hypothetical protein E6J79_00950 [Deltaproteobacteria bacterium]